MLAPSMQLLQHYETPSTSLRDLRSIQSSIYTCTHSCEERTNALNLDTALRLRGLAKQYFFPWHVIFAMATANEKTVLPGVILQ